MTLAVSIVLPTYNEAENIGLIIPKVCETFKHANLKGEIIVVDDGSTDGTLEVVESLSRTYAVRGIDRSSKPRSLSLSVVEGFESSEAEVCVVMDADMSHPVETLPDMIKPILANEADITVGSRNIEGGGSEHWPWHRVLVSRLAASFAYGLTKMTDPTTGFMGLKRSLLSDIKLNPIGWKIVLETVFHLQDKRIKEVPIVFRDRQHGESKLGAREQLEFLMHVYSLYKQQYPDTFEFIKFSLVGLSGVFVDLLLVYLCFSVFNLDLRIANISGFIVALTSNYILNRFWSFRYGRDVSFIKGYGLFALICSLGLALRLGIVHMFMHRFTSGVEPLLLSSTGIVAAAVFNFLGSRFLVFSKR